VAETTPVTFPDFSRISIRKRLECAMVKSLFSFILTLLLPWASHAADAQYGSMARMLVGGLDVNPKLENGEPIPESFYGTCVELLQVTAVVRGAHARVHALHPDLPPQHCKLEVGRMPGTRVIVLRAFSSEPAYTKAYLDAVMDEFLAKRKEMQAAGGQGAWEAVMDELVRLEKEIPLAEQRIKASEQNGTAPDQLIEPKAKLQQMKMVYDRLLGTARKLQDKPRESGPVFSIIERASVPILLKPSFSLPNLFK
jgi:hypothetical protein